MFNSLLSEINIAGLIVGIVLIVVAFIVFLIIVPLSIWFRALVSGAPISMGKLVGMRLRKIKIGMIVEAYITGKKAGLDIKIGELETHYMAKGNVEKVVNALISAHSANIELTTTTAMAIDLAGRDVLDAVRVSVNPKVIETPVIAAIAKDGIELRCKARVTVRASNR